MEENKAIINKNLLNLEQSNRDKFGPRSIAKSWKDRLPGFLDYYNHQDDYPNSKLKLPRVSNNLRPLSASNAIQYLKNNTNSGLPFYTRKGKIKDSVLSDFNSLLSRKDPCVLFTRTQEAGKTRNVWGYPVADTLNEMCYYRPLLNRQKMLSWRSALLGPDEVDKSITNMINRSNVSIGSFISLDFSSFDATVGKNLQAKAFDYVKSCFQESESDNIEYIKQRFNTIEILTPSGVYSGSHGVPSGATFTNEIDSLAQYIIAINSGAVRESDINIQGDDGAYYVLDDNIDALYNSFDSSGLILNKEKSYLSKDYLVYLQRLYDKQYIKDGLIGGIYSIYRALNRIIYQERYSDFEDYDLSGKDYYSIRSISILENCKYHPLFVDFVKLIYKIDKLSLKYNKEAISKYVRMLRQGPGTLGFINNQLGEDVSGIENFETVKIIKSLH